MEGQSGEYVFQPHPESPYWNKDLPKYVETRLGEVAARANTEVEVSLRTHQSPERVLYNRLVDLMSEEIAGWDDDAMRKSYSEVEVAFGIIAFPKFNKSEQSVFVNRLDRYKKLLKAEGDEATGISLSPEQTGLLKTIAQRIDLPYDESLTDIPFWVVDDKTPKRITEIEDPKVSQLLEEETEDKIGKVLSEIGQLSEKQKVKLLLGLSKEEFEEYKRRREEGFRKLADDIDEEAIPDPVERIRARSRLQHATPKHEIAAELRRRYLDNGEDYPATMDSEFEEIEDSNS